MSDCSGYNYITGFTEHSRPFFFSNNILIERFYCMQESESVSTVGRKFIFQGTQMLVF